MNEFILTALGAAYDGRRGTDPLKKDLLTILNTFHASDETIITNGLRVAISEFEEDAKFHELHADGLAVQFRLQAKQTRDFLERFESIGEDD